MLVRLTYITVWLMLLNPFIVFFLACGFIQHYFGGFVLTWMLPFVVVGSLLVWHEIWNGVRTICSELDAECIRRMGWNKR